MTKFSTCCRAIKYFINFKLFENASVGSPTEKSKVTSQVNKVFYRPTAGRKFSHKKGFILNGKRAVTGNIDRKIL